MRKQHAKAAGLFLLKLAGTTLFLWWAFSRINDGYSLVENFRHALKSPFWVVAGIGLAFVTLQTSALRWFLLLRAQSINEPFWYIFRLTLYGAFFNIASFGTAAGDAAKIVLLMRRVPDNKVGVTVSVMADHVVGFLSSGLIFLVFVWGFGTMDHVRDPAGRSLFVAATWFEAGGMIGIILSVVSCMPGFLVFGRRYLPRITNNRWVDRITTVIDLYRTRWHFALYASVVSLVMAASFYLTFFAGLRALEQPVRMSSIMAVMPIVDVASALPISISGLGVRERTFDYFLSQLTGIPTAAAVSASLIGFLFNLFWGLVGGLAIVTARQSKTAQHESLVPADESSHG